MRYHLIDLLRGTRTMDAYHRLMTGWDDAIRLKALQQEQLGTFLNRLKGNHPVYRRLLSETTATDIQQNPVQVLEQLPIADKAFITQAGEGYLAPVDGRKWQNKQTGGSTGEPFRYAIDLESVSQSWAFHLLCWNTHAGYQPGDPYITVAGSSLGATGHRLKVWAYRKLQNNFLIPGDRISGDLKINRAAVWRARLLYCYPSSLVSLLECRPTLFSEHRLQAVFTTSEQLLPPVRRFIEETLQVPVYDMYGANDGGVISCECDRHDGYHYDPFNCYVETEYNAESGANELLLTSMNSFSFPFVRYRVGDIATLDDFGSCGCGNPFPMITGLSGRTRDVLKMPDGSRVHGVVFNRLFFDFPEVRRYRIVQEKDFQVTVMLDVEVFEAWKHSSACDQVLAGLSDILGTVSFSVEPLKHTPGDNRKLKLIESHVL